MSGHNERASLSTAYLLQAVLIVVWWVAISASDAVYRVFEFPGIEQSVLFKFLLPDIALVAVLSLYRAYRQSRDVQLIILGAFLYATLFCINASFTGRGGYFSTVVMLIGMGYNVFLCYAHRFFRVSGTSSLVINALKTAVQVMCVWLLTLGVIPLLMLMALGQPLAPEQGIYVGIGGVLLGLFSIFGIWSASVMVVEGNGTPLPLDQPQSLVITGPYQFVRNPMAVAGIGQGLAISLMYLSIPILLYALLGAIIWHIVVRPREEEDLLNRFGEAYEAYRQRVRCWIPWGRNS